MNAAAAAMLAEISNPRAEPIPDDARRVTVTLADGTEITGLVSPSASPTDPICIIVRADGPEPVRVFVDRDHIASVMANVADDDPDQVVPARLRLRRG